MHHRHAVFNGNRLPAVRLHVDIAACQNGQDQRLLAVDQMAPIEFGADRNRQLQPPHRRFGRRPVWNCSDEIAAEPNENFGALVDHRLDCVYDIVAIRARRLEAKHVLYMIEQFWLRLFVDTHCAITLHIGVTAYRANSRPKLADIAAQ